MAEKWHSGATKKFLGIGLEKLHTNKAINTAFDVAVASGKDVYDVIKRGLDGEDLGEVVKSIYKEGDNWNTGRIAGSYLAASSAARIATGGGLTRDRNGNNNIIGIPGI